jgi:hypothetical protein
MCGFVEQNRVPELAIADQATDAEALNANQDQDDEYLAPCDRRKQEVLAARECLRLPLMRLGGDGVDWEKYDPELRPIAERGRLIQGRVRSFSGLHDTSQTNVAALWSQNPYDLSIVTGYALCEDGQWRKHAWLKDGNDIVETTTTRLRYFGVVLNAGEAADFWFDHYLWVKHPEAMSVWTDSL